MYSLILLASLTFSADVRNLGCKAEWKTLCALNTIESLTNNYISEVNSNGLTETLTSTKEGNYFTAEDRANGYFPWVVEKPDTTKYGLTHMTPVSLEYVSTAMAHIVDSSRGWNTVTLGLTTSPQDEVTFDGALGGDNIVIVMTESNTKNLIICTGETESPCNVFVASTTFADIKYDLQTLELTEIETKLNALEYDSDSFVTVLMHSDGSFWGHENATTTWFDSAQIENYREIAFVQDSKTYEGWAYPLSKQGVTYQVATYYKSDQEPVLPVATWESLELSSPCPPSTFDSTCAHDYVSVILGSIQKDLLTMTMDAIISKFNNGDYNQNGWAPELRSMASGSLVASSSGLLNPIPTDKEIHLIATEALAQSSDGGWVEFSTSQGPYRTFVIQVGADNYAMVGYINSATQAPTAAPADAPGDDSSSSGWSVFTSVAVVLVVVFGN